MYYVFYISYLTDLYIFAFLHLYMFANIFMFFHFLSLQIRFSLRFFPFIFLRFSHVSSSRFSFQIPISSSASKEWSTCRSKSRASKATPWSRSGGHFNVFSNVWKKTPEKWKDENGCEVWKSGKPESRTKYDKAGQTRTAPDFVEKMNRICMIYRMIYHYIYAIYCMICACGHMHTCTVSSNASKTNAGQTGPTGQTSPKNKKNRPIDKNNNNIQTKCKSFRIFIHFPL